MYINNQTAHAYNKERMCPLMNSNFAELNEKQLEKINALADEMNVVLVAYNKTGTPLSPEGGSSEANNQKNDHFS